jgi:hypothetical protein
MPIGNVADLIAETLIQAGVKPYAMIGTPFGARSLWAFRGRASQRANHSRGEAKEQELPRVKS